MTWNTWVAVHRESSSLGNTIWLLWLAIIMTACLCVATTPQPTSGVAVPDAQWLLQLYASTNGGGWSSACSTGWQRTTAPCSGSKSRWNSRVLCNSNGRVYHVNLNSCNLRGTLPASSWNNISNGGMSQLVNLYLSGNLLNGTLPEFWNSLPSLQVISLQNNQFAGSLPSSWDSLHSLQAISLQNNQFTGSLPPSWSGLGSLQSVVLYSNRLTGSLPESWCGLRSLRAFYLNNNLLNGTLPLSYSSLVLLQRMYLSGNRFSGSLPLNWSSLLSLQYLRLNSNQLTGALPSSWEGKLVFLVPTGLMLQRNCLNVTDAQQSVTSSWWAAKTGGGVYLRQSPNCSAASSAGVTPSPPPSAASPQACDDDLCVLSFTEERSVSEPLYVTETVVVGEEMSSSTTTSATLSFTPIMSSLTRTTHHASSPSSATLSSSLNSMTSSESTTSAISVSGVSATHSSTASPSLSHGSLSRSSSTSPSVSSSLEVCDPSIHCHLSASPDSDIGNNMTSPIDGVLQVVVGLMNDDDNAAGTPIVANASAATFRGALSYAASHSNGSSANSTATLLSGFYFMDMNVSCSNAPFLPPFAGFGIRLATPNASSWVQLQQASGGDDDSSQQEWGRVAAVSAQVTKGPPSSANATLRLKIARKDASRQWLDTWPLGSTWYDSRGLTLNISVELRCGGNASRVSLLLPIASDVRISASNTDAVTDAVSSSFNVVSGVLSGGAGGAVSLAALDLLQCSGSSLYPTLDDVVTGDSPLSYLISPWRRFGLMQAMIGNVLTMAALYVIHGCCVVALMPTMVESSGDVVLAASSPEYQGSSDPETSGCLRTATTVLCQVLFLRFITSSSTSSSSSTLLWRACSSARFPSTSLRLMVILLPGTVLIAFGLVVGSADRTTSVWTVAPAVMVIGLTCATLVVCFRLAAKYLIGQLCFVVPFSRIPTDTSTDETVNVCLRSVVGVSPRVDWMPEEVAQACGPLIGDAVDKRAAQFLFVQVLLLNVAVSGLAGLAAATTDGVACRGVSALMGALHLAAVVWYAARRPFRSPIDAVLVPLQSVLVCVLCWMTAASVERPPWLKLLQSLVAVGQIATKATVTVLLRRFAPPDDSDCDREASELGCELPLPDIGFEVHQEDVGPSGGCDLNEVDDVAAETQHRHHHHHHSQIFFGLPLYTERSDQSSIEEDLWRGVDAFSKEDSYAIFGTLTTAQSPSEGEEEPKFLD